MVSAHDEHAASTADSHELMNHHIIKPIPDQHGQRPALLGSGVTDQEVKVDPAPGISCLAKDGETADCSKDPAVVKEAIKLIEKSPHPNARVRVIQRSKQSGNHATIRRTSRGSPLQTDQTTKLQRKVKDLERQLSGTRVELAKMQVAAKSFKKKKRTR